MSRYIFKRILFMIVAFIIISLLLFGIYKLMPGDPVAMQIDSAHITNPQKYEMIYNATKERMGIDKPLTIQYLSWIKGFIVGEWGYSSQYRVPVLQLIKEPLWNTFMLNITALIISLIISIPIGVLTAIKKNSYLDRAVQVSTVILVSIPQFILSLILIYIFAVQIPVLPVSGMSTSGFKGEYSAVLIDRLRYMALPLIVIVLGSLAGITRYMRGAMCAQLSKSYILTARAKGLSNTAVIWTHAFKNSAIILVSSLPFWLLGALGGCVIIETIFKWNGIGYLLYNSLRQMDFAVVIAMNMLYVVISLIFNLISDILYLFIDPRVKYK